MVGEQGNIGAHLYWSKELVVGTCTKWLKFEGIIEAEAEKALLWVWAKMLSPTEYPVFPIGATRRRSVNSIGQTQAEEMQMKKQQAGRPERFIKLAEVTE